MVHRQHQKEVVELVDEVLHVHLQRVQHGQGNGDVLGDQGRGLDGERQDQQQREVRRARGAVLSEVCVFLGLGVGIFDPPEVRGGAIHSGFKVPISERFLLGVGELHVAVRRGKVQALLKRPLQLLC